MDEHVTLSRRERQIMDIVYRLKEATVNQVVEVMSDRPSRVTVRTMLRVLEEKGHLKHTVQGREFVYRPSARGGAPASRPCGGWWRPSLTARWLRPWLRTSSIREQRSTKRS